LILKGRSGKRKGEHPGREKKKPLAPLGGRENPRGRVTTKRKKRRVD